MPAKIVRLLLILLPLFSFFTSAKSQMLPQVEIQTSLGKILIEVDTVHAPVTAANFLKHVTEGSYNKSFFYRTVRLDNQPGSSVKIEVIQGGLYSDEEINKHPVIRHETTEETGLKHLDGVISMARNEPGTASTEFFICIGNQPELDYSGKRNPDEHGFAAFGKVIQGMDVVRKIQQLPNKDQYLDNPVQFTASIKKE
ncbi:peptidyl-prolyl cis-trans isomerase A (cyclophilin A) [Mariniphaga anaerophila]|uniref:peptidylprolyl isomerase n=1 Tax=Mariniphaga anaerophila TaxID=1484053 RepID=A0A1M5CS83_9BACT|nr:peptidylprolyl isomerase [Mariniphaga anaerophila]SHF57625.1 peptidyl-prolyl cis-trans isomerase A (cyclophilin A) [Mariniphaga anaerophila]